MMSTLQQISLIEASDDQLRWFGANVLGIDMAGLRTRTKIMSAIGPAWDRDTVSVPAEVPEQDDQTEKPVVKVDAKNDFTSVMQAPTITVKLMTNGAAINGKDDVYVNCQTKGLRFARNVPIKMPYPFFRVLQDAVSGSVSQDADNEFVETEVHNYPYQILEPVDPAALAAFDAAVGQKFLYA